MPPPGNGPRLASAAMPALFSGSVTFSWRPDGLLGSRAWPAGTTETFTYDAAKLLSRLQVRTRCSDGFGDLVATIVLTPASAASS